MNLPKHVLEIFESADEKYPSDGQKAAEWALGQLVGLEEWKDIQPIILLKGVRDYIDQRRHDLNRAIRNGAGNCNNDPKANRLNSKAVNRSYEFVLNFRIGGTRLGLLYGRDLERIAQEETGLADGHLFRRDLARWLGKKIPENELVQDAMPAEQIAKGFYRILKKHPDLDIGVNGQASTPMKPTQSLPAKN